MLNCIYKGKSALYFITAKSSNKNKKQKQNLQGMSLASSQLYSHSVSWKSYQLLKKKAMEQELSWSGLIISLSIAFFIVAGCAVTLRMIANTFEEAQASKKNEGHEQVIERPNLAQSIFGVRIAEAAAVPYQASVSTGTEFITLLQGKESQQSITFKNTGSVIWKVGDVSFETGPYLKTPSKVATDTWKKFNEPVALPRNVQPGESVTISFPIKAPLTIEGTIQENFQLVSAQHPIPGSLTRFFITINRPQVVASPSFSKIPVSLPAASAPTEVAVPLASNTSVKLCSTISSDFSVEYINCNTNQNETSVGNGIASNILLSSAPILRVGLFSTFIPQRLTVDQLFDVYTGNQIIFSNVSAGTILTLSFNQATKQYSVVAPSITQQATSPIRIIPKTTNGIITLLDYRLGQKTPDNRFRNIIEYRYNDTTKAAWFINELGIESYLKGLAETSNSSPVEFQKVMATAARSYAIYHYMRGVNFGLTNASTKHAAEGFHVDSEYDQVYRGYNSELRLSSLSQAVEATKGAVVTFQNKPVITPYFSNSDGHTRDWVEVWGGSAMAWLKSVIVPQDNGKILFGHGVGLSARGALAMVNEGQSWQNVLKYFYTGTEVKKIY